MDNGSPISDSSSGSQPMDPTKKRNLIIGLSVFGAVSLVVILGAIFGDKAIKSKKSKKSKTSNTSTTTAAENTYKNYAGGSPTTDANLTLNSVMVAAPSPLPNDTISSATTTTAVQPSVVDAVVPSQTTLSPSSSSSSLSSSTLSNTMSVLTKEEIDKKKAECAELLGAWDPKTNTCASVPFIKDIRACLEKGVDNIATSQGECWSPATPKKMTSMGDVRGSAVFDSLFLNSPALYTGKRVFEASGYTNVSPPTDPIKNIQSRQLYSYSQEAFNRVMPCPPFSAGVNCKCPASDRPNRLCDDSSGDAVFSCLPPWSGTFCTCDGALLKKNQLCDDAPDGVPKVTCKEGFYGINCVCPSWANGNPNVDFCNGDTGLVKCKSGYSGAQCEIPPSKCPPDFDSASSIYLKCDPLTGFVTCSGLPEDAFSCDIKTDATTSKLYGVPICKEGFLWNADAKRCEVVCPEGFEPYEDKKSCHKKCPAPESFLPNTFASCDPSTGAISCKSLPLHGENCDEFGKMNCKPGWTGPLCDCPVPLPEGVFKCSTGGVFECQSGYLLNSAKQCVRMCPSDLFMKNQFATCDPETGLISCPTLPATAEKCDPVTGALVCKPGFTGPLCACPEVLPDNVLGCTGPGSFECKPGFTLDPTNKKCFETCDAVMKTPWVVCDPLTGVYDCSPSIKTMPNVDTCYLGPPQAGMTRATDPLWGTLLCKPGFTGPQCACPEVLPEGVAACGPEGAFVCTSDYTLRNITNTNGVTTQKCVRACPAVLLPNTVCDPETGNISCQAFPGNPNITGCNVATGDLICAPGFSGAQCMCPGTLPTNATSCNPDGTLVCGPGWSGPTCACPTLLGPNVQSCDPLTGILGCKPGFTGKNCDCPTVLPPNATFCADGIFSCAPGFTGKTCACPVVLPKNVATCADDGTFGCDPGFTGKNCDCPTSLPANAASCSDGVFACKPGFTGADCLCPTVLPPNALSCGPAGVFTCAPGFAGKTCQCPTVLPNNAASCADDGTFVCNPGFTGENCDCPTSLPANAASCLNGVFTCKPGFSGADCMCPAVLPPNVQSCGPGGVFACKTGFSGKNCACPAVLPPNVVSCDSDAAGNAVFTCDPLFAGAQCDCPASLPAGTASCSSPGGVLTCSPGFSLINNRCVKDCPATLATPYLTCSASTGEVTCVTPLPANAQSCDPATGLLTCKPGFSGQNCACPATLPPNMTSCTDTLSGPLGINCAPNYGPTTLAAGKSFDYLCSVYKLAPPFDVSSPSLVAWLDGSDPLDSSGLPVDKSPAPKTVVPDFSVVGSAFGPTPSTFFDKPTLDLTNGGLKMYADASGAPVPVASSSWIVMAFVLESKNPASSSRRSGVVYPSTPGLYGTAENDYGSLFDHNGNGSFGDPAGAVQVANSGLSVAAIPPQYNNLRGPSISYKRSDSRVGLYATLGPDMDANRYATNLALPYDVPIFVTVEVVYNPTTTVTTKTLKAYNPLYNGLTPADGLNLTKTPFLVSRTNSAGSMPQGAAPIGLSRVTVDKKLGLKVRLAEFMYLQNSLPGTTTLTQILGYLYTKWVVPSVPTATIYRPLADMTFAPLLPTSIKGIASDPTLMLWLDASRYQNLSNLASMAGKMRDFSMYRRHLWTDAVYEAGSGAAGAGAGAGGVNGKPGFAHIVKMRADGSGVPDRDVSPLAGETLFYPKRNITITHPECSFTTLQNTFIFMVGVIPSGKFGPGGMQKVQGPTPSVIFGHDQNMGAYLPSSVTTYSEDDPSIDKLAKRGLFLNAYSSTPAFKLSPQTNVLFPVINEVGADGLETSGEFSPTSPLNTSATNVNAIDLSSIYDKPFLMQFTCAMVDGGLLGWQSMRVVNLTTFSPTDSPTEKTYQTMYTSSVSPIGLGDFFIGNSNVLNRESNIKFSEVLYFQNINGTKQLDVLSYLKAKWFT